MAKKKKTPEVPTCEAWAEHGPMLMEFLDWFNHQGDVTVDHVDWSNQASDQALVCRFLEIDEKKLEAERRSILEAMRDLN